MKDEIQIKIDAQLLYQQATKQPMFAPKDGKCWACKKQIYEGISLEKAATTLITGCPHCHRSFVG